ncbi:MAG: PilZ domain-containing protein [Pseudomonadota bacterium]
MSEQAHGNVRWRHRHKWGVEVRVTDSQTNDVVTCRSLDVSEDGVRIVSPRSFEREAFVVLTMHLPGMPGMFDLNGQIRWCEKRETDYLLGAAIDLASAEVSRAKPLAFRARLFGM